MANGSAPGDYVGLSIGLAYIEGVEQYRQGKSTPSKRSGPWFKASARRLFPLAGDQAVNRLWEAVRNGLFHSGFTKGPTLLSHDRPDAIAISGQYLIINPARFVDVVIEDFKAYVDVLRANPSGDEAAKFVAFTDLSTASEAAESARDRGLNESVVRRPISASGAASVRRACHAPGAGRP